MKQITKTVVPYLIVAILSILLFRQCTKQKVTVTTTFDYERIVDSLKSNIKIPEPVRDTVFLDSVIYLKSKPILVDGKETIIYKTDTIRIPVEVNRFDTELKANDATANLSIYTSGNLFNVTGTIEYDRETKTIERTTRIHKNGTYLYLETSIVPFWKKTQIGIDRTIGRKIIIGGSVEYMPHNKEIYFNTKLGYNLSKN
jgi:hypothetical protein